MNDKFDIVIGDEAMALYKNGHLAARAVKLTFGDIIDECGIRCDFWSGDLETYDRPEKFPPHFKDVQLDGSDMEASV